MKNLNFSLNRLNYLRYDMTWKNLINDKLINEAKFLKPIVDISSSLQHLVSINEFRLDPF